MNPEVTAARQAFDAKINVMTRRVAAAERRVAELEQGLTAANAAIRVLQQTIPVPTVPVLPVRQ